MFLRMIRALVASFPRPATAVAEALGLEMIEVVSRLRRAKPNTEITRAEPQ